MPNPQPFSIQIPHPLSPRPHPLQPRAAPSHSPHPTGPRPPAPHLTSHHRTTRYVARPGSFSFTFTGSIPPPVLTPAQELSSTPTLSTIIVFSILMVCFSSVLLCHFNPVQESLPRLRPPFTTLPPHSCASKMSPCLQRNPFPQSSAPFLHYFQYPRSTPLDSAPHGTPHASLTP
jgi:hypothetical protein